MPYYHARIPKNSIHKEDLENIVPDARIIEISTVNPMEYFLFDLNETDAAKIKLISENVKFF